LVLLLCGGPGVSVWLGTRGEQRYWDVGVLRGGFVSLQQKFWGRAMPVPEGRGCGWVNRVHSLRHGGMVGELSSQP
jgi:hypothetical protein